MSLVVTTLAGNSWEHGGLLSIIVRCKNHQPYWPINRLTCAAFNATLVVFGGAAAREISGQQNMERLNSVKLTLGKAMDALAHLGRGHTLTDRCIIYVSRLAKVVDEWSKTTISVTSKMEILF